MRQRLLLLLLIDALSFAVMRITRFLLVLAARTLSRTAVWRVAAMRLRQD
jgi:hypothetical protein